MRTTKVNILLILLTLLAGFLHFYNLLWGAPFFFHPDERNIASSVTQLLFPTQMNPHFFAYGSFPIYLTYFLAILFTRFSSTHVDFAQAIIVLRFVSSLLATLLIPSLFFIGKKLHNSTTGLIAATLGVFSTGIIQFAHFGTFEIWEAMLSLWIFYLCLLHLEKLTMFRMLLVAALCGLAIGTKVSMIVILLLSPLVMFSHLFPFTPKRLWTFLQYSVIFFCATALTYLLTNPFVLLDKTSFLNSMHYESSVALGSLPVFYTGEFVHTIPILYQLFHVFPFLINPLLTAVSIPALCFVLLFGITRRNKSYVLLATCLILLFFSHAFFYVKWIRYMVPTIPFIYLIISVALSQLFSDFKEVLRSKYYVVSILIVVCAASSLSYFYTAFVQPDSRIAAATWAQQHIPSNVYVISEVYDLGIIPFNSYFPHITLFNAYDLDTPIPTTIEQNLLQQSKYIILPSQRILQSRLLHPNAFPNGNLFYYSLLNGAFGFKQIYQTPCDIFCIITFLGDPVFSFEQTANVFDRPEVYIFKKI